MPRITIYLGYNDDKEVIIAPQFDATQEEINDLITLVSEVGEKLDLRSYVEVWE